MRETTDIDRHVGRRLRQARLVKNMTQTEIATAAGIRFQQIQKYEAGQNRIAAGTLFTFCKTLGVQPNYFFEGISHGN